MTRRETEEKLRKLAAIDKDAASKGWLFYLAGEGEERGEADDLLDVILHKGINKDFTKQILLEPPSKKACTGEYALGKVIYPNNSVFSDFGLRQGEWTRHVLITGMTGAGKTNLAFKILDELRAKQKPFLIFDWKRNYRDLLQLPRFNKTRVYTVARTIAPFHFNPLIPPPGTEAGQWLMKLADVLAHSYFVGEGVLYLLRNALDQVYEECGYLSGARHTTPTFHMVRRKIAGEQQQGRMMLWKASTTRVMEALCFRHGLGPVVNVEHEWDYQQFLKNDIVLELDALSDSDKVFLVEAIILWLYEYRKNQDVREQFTHCTVIEEAHHVLSEKKEGAEGTETIMETCLRQIREFGEAVIAIDQEPTKMSNSIKANTYTKITFNLANGKDVLDMASSMSLNTEETECINLLDVGHAIVSLKGRVHTPLHVLFPKSDIKKGLITDQKLMR